MTTHLKILGLSLLALTLVIAANADAAQAKWLLLRNGESVSSLFLNHEVEESELLVPALGLAIHCSGGEGSISISLSEANKSLNGLASETLYECDDLEFGEACEIMSSGHLNGEIDISGFVAGRMDAKGRTLLEVEDFTLSVIQYLGEECPLAEINGTLSGYTEFEVFGPLVNATLHQINLISQELYFGESLASLHNGSLEELSGSLTEASGATFAFHLVEL